MSGASVFARKLAACVLSAALALGLAPLAASADDAAGGERPLAVGTMTSSDVPEAVDKACSGVLRLYFQIDGMDFTGGSCFLVNPSILITAYTNTMFSEAELAAFGYGADDAQALRDRATYAVEVYGDIRVSASLVNYSEDLNFAILMLQQPLPSLKPLALRNRVDVNTGEKAYALGYRVPTGLASATKGTVKSKAGTALRTGDEATRRIVTSSDMAGCVGGPLVDSAGCVMGLNLGNSYASGESYALPADAFTRVLDVLGVEHTIKRKSGNGLEAKAARAKFVARAGELVKNPVTVKGANGNVKYSNASVSKKAKAFRVDAKTGAISVPKGTKAGTYKVTVKVRAAGTTKKRAASKAVTVKVVVR